MAVAAMDIAPNAFSQGKGDAVEEDLQFDLRNLLVTNPHPVDMEALAADKELYLKAATRDAMQALAGRLFDLPSEPSSVGPVATLPTEQIIALPRAKPVPAPKEPTRWEKFAKEKGIDGRKRERMVWDEVQGEFKPRWGYKRARGGVEDEGIVEVKQGQDPMADPWSEARAAKKARVEKNTKNRGKNRERAAAGGALAAGIPVDLTAAASDGGLSARGGGKSGGGRERETRAAVARRGKEGTKKALDLVQRSTASMGKFDVKRDGEPERRIRGTRRTFGAATDPVAAKESQSALQVLRGVLVNREKGGTKGTPATKAATRESLAAYDAVEGEPDRGAKKKKGRQAVGKFKKVTKKRAK